MRNHKITIGAVMIMLVTAMTSLADVKIKTRETMRGQSSENTTYIKGKRSRTETGNGMLITITQCDLRGGVQLNPGMQTYMINEFAQAIQRSSQNTAVTDKKGVVESGGRITTTITTKEIFRSIFIDSAIAPSQWKIVLQNNSDREREVYLVVWNDAVK